MVQLTEKQQHWADIIDSWAASGLSQTDYCRQQGINPKNFYSWKHTVDKKRNPTEKKGAFVQLPVTATPPATASSSITLNINGVHIQYCHDTDEKLLSQLIRFLRGGDCDSSQ